MKEVRLVFADEKVKKAYEKLSDKSEMKKLKRFIDRALEDIKKDPFCSIEISKKLVPNEFKKKYGIDTLWKYDLPNGWRLLYSVAGHDIFILAIILEWCNHKNYEKRMKYKIR